VVRPRPPLAPPSESSLRRLSRARRAERPLRAQTVLGAMLGLILVAVPFYLLRKPDGTSAAAERAEPKPFGSAFPASVDAGAPPSSVVLGPIQRVRCGASVFDSNIEGESCDPLPPLEAAFRQSILGSVECAPRTGKEGSLNFVLEVDFSNDRYNVFPGRSGKWRGPQARRATQCVLKAFPPLDLHGVRHQYAYYAIAVLAEYPAPDALSALPPR
jgi:hypothetical protein